MGDWIKQKETSPIKKNFNFLKAGTAGSFVKLELAEDLQVAGI